MKLETFFEKFDQFADALDAVKRMRELVLQFAVQGRLISQSPVDEPAGTLVVRISEDRAAFVKARSIARQRVFAPVADEQRPFALPSGWLWTRLGNLCRVQAGFAFESALFAQGDSGVPIIRIRDIAKDRTQVNYLGEYREEFLVNAGDYLVGMDGNFAVARWRGPRALLNQRVSRLQWYSQQLEPSFFATAVQYRLSELQGTKAYTTVDHLSSGQIENAVVPLPPLAEQKRIVAKVDELMTLCDRLESQQWERETRGAALARASLARFAEVPTPANLRFLFHQSYTIPSTDLRKTILTLAVKGKLVPQDPNDGNAREVINRAIEKRQQIIHLKNLRRKVIDQSKEFAIEEGLPASWCVERLANLVDPENTISYGVLVPGPDVRSGIPFVRVQDLSILNPTKRPNKTIAPEVEKPYARTRLRGGEILLCVVGTIGRLGVAPDSWAGANIARAVARIAPIEEVNRDYLLLVLRSSAVQSYFAGTTRTLAQPTLNVRAIEQTPIPLPPIGEQRRIVAKLNQMMALVDDLETQLAASYTTGELLFSAIVNRLTGAKQLPELHQSARDTSRMKKHAADAIERRASSKPLRVFTKKFVLRRFAMSSGYRSLGAFDCTYHLEQEDADEASPVVLVGLNGSGKSNLLEAAAEVFCFLELINLPWRKVASPSSRYRENGHRFELEYTLKDERGTLRVRVRKTKKAGAEFFIVSEDGTETLVEARRERLRLLPRRIIGYSSGLNETVSHPFLRTKTIYSEEVRDAAPVDGAESADDDPVFDTRTLYMDYESNAAILISNYIFQKPLHLEVINEFTRVQAVSCFGIRFNRKRAGKSGPNSIVRLTNELKADLRSFAICAGVSYDDQQVEYDLRFVLNADTKKLFRQEFKTAEALFMAMHKWSLLNALILSDEQRKVYLSSDITKGALERPPSVPPSDRVFNIVDLKLRLTQPAIEIDYSGLSDGEHQFIQVFGTALLFSEPGTLFLFDEPESHFNPEWRTKFNLIMNRLPNASRQEYIISTHSPFVVSGSRQGNVYKFTRTGGEISCDPVTFETRGASFDDLLKRLFSINSFIDESVREKLEGIIRKGDLSKMQDAVGDFAESKEKRRLYEAIIEKEG